MPNDDRGQRFDHALARHLPSASPDPSCPDAEILAAYHDRTLSTNELSRCKEHIAGCSRCQEILALVEQTKNLPAAEWERQNRLQPVEQPAAPTVFRAAAAVSQQNAQPSHLSSISAEIHDEMDRLRHRPSWRVLVPLGALAATVILWIGAREVRTQHGKQAYEAELAQNRLAVAPLPTPRAEPPLTAKKQEPATARDEIALAQKKTASSSPEPSEQPTSSAPLVSAESVGSADSATSEQENAIRGVTPGKAATKMLPSGAMARSQTPAARATSPTVAGTAGANRSGSAEAKQRADIVAQTMAESLQAQAATPANATSAQMDALPAADNLLRLAAASHRYIVAPGEAHAWILGSAGQILYTTDRGKTWKPQTSGVIADLTAGSATSDEVCWVVGRAGTLLLTIDGGQYWKLLRSPISGDLGGVHATDARRASIWDVPNRISYETSDGGVTWRRTANE